MNPVPESVIEKAIEELEGENYERLVSELQLQQDVVMGWLFSPEFDAFTRQEREFLLYLVMVLARAIGKVRTGGLPEVRPEQLTEREDANWALLAQSASRVFHERLDAFFEESEQEDLLAFAEDALSDYEDGMLTKEGREGLFVVLKTLIDCWTQP